MSDKKLCRWPDCTCSPDLTMCNPARDDQDPEEVELPDFAGDDLAALRSEVERLTREVGMITFDRDEERVEREADRRDVARLTRERDEAREHDQQPYPTADAYEAACHALAKHRAIADEATTLLLSVLSTWHSDYGHARQLRNRFEAPIDRPRTASLAEQLAAAIDERDSLSSQLAEARATGEAMGKVVEAVRAKRSELKAASWRGYDLDVVLAAIDDLGTAEVRAKLTKENA